MDSRIEQAVAKKASGQYNCAQAVACTYCDIAGLDQETIKHVANAFGSGMGNTEGTCGAIIGAGIVLGLKHRDRIMAMKAMMRIMNAFRQRNQTTICRELKGIGTGCMLRHCNDCVADAASLLEAELSSME